MRVFIKYIENCWRSLFVGPILRLFIHNNDIKGIIDISSVKKLLIIRNDRIGDMIVTTPILKMIKRANPDIQIGVIASHKNVEIIRDNPNVDNIYVLQNNAWKLFNVIKNIRRERYNLLFNFVFTNMTFGGILANLISPNGIKVGQGKDKYKFYYNKLLSVDRHIKPMVEVLKDFVEEATGIDMSAQKCVYDIVVNDDIRKGVHTFLQDNHITTRQKFEDKDSRYIVLNISVADKERKITAEQVHAILGILNKYKEYKTVLIHDPNDYAMISVKEDLTAKGLCLYFTGEHDNSLLEIAYLIEGAHAVVTPDTSIIHFASAFKTPIFGIYSKLLHEWIPYNVKNQIIIAENNRPVSSISNRYIINALNNFIGTLSSVSN